MLKKRIKAILILILIAAAIYYAAVNIRLPFSNTFRQAKLGDVVEELNGLKIYNEFLTGIKSGSITKDKIGIQSLYDFFTYTREQINFGELHGIRRMTYLNRNPFVFWHVDAPNYFDGSFYFYKYDGQWYVDSPGRYEGQLEKEYIGIPAAPLADFEMKSSVVYESGDGYEWHYITEHNSLKQHYEIKAHIDSEMSIPWISIVFYKLTTDKNLEPLEKVVDIIYITYDQINSDISVEKPADLNMNDFRYLYTSFDEEYEY